MLMTEDFPTIWQIL